MNGERIERNAVKSVLLSSLTRVQCVQPLSTPAYLFSPSDPFLCRRKINIIGGEGILSNLLFN